MEDDLDRGISLLVSMLTRSIKSEDAYKITQSALNLAHVKSVLKSVELGEPRVKMKAAT
jgi:hypothetical protein